MILVTIGAWKVITFYKITNIVHLLWLAKNCVCMRVCKHGCDIKVFCSSRANHAMMNLKKFLSENLTSLLYLPIPLLAETWKIFTTMLSQLSFHLSWHIKQKISILESMKSVKFQSRWPLNFASSYLMVQWVWLCTVGLGIAEVTHV